MSNELTRFDPFDDFRQIRRVMERFMGMPVGLQDFENIAQDAMLPVDVYQKDGQLVVRAAVPGVDPNDIRINVRDNILTIDAETRQEQDVEEGNYLRHEYRYGRISRAIRLPNDVDVSKAEARCENGILRLCFPQTQSNRSQEHRIEVQAGGQQRIEAQAQGPQQQQQQQQQQWPARTTSKA